MSEMEKVGGTPEVEEPPKNDEGKKPSKNEGFKKLPGRKRIRFEWLDQFRGIVIVLFIVQTFAYAFSSDMILPPMVNHGYQYINLGAGFPKIITLIDLGAAIFIFLVGFMQAFTVLKRFQKTDKKWRVFMHILLRAGMVWILAIIHILGSGKDFGDWDEMVYNGTLAHIAWAGLAAGLVCLFVKKADNRFWIGLGLMICTTALWIMIDPMGPYVPLFSSTFLEEILPILGFCEIAIFAAAVTGWIFNEDGSINEGNWKKRVLPFAFGFMVLSFLSWFIQWADHHAVNMSLSTMAIGFSTLMIFTFYKMEKAGFKIPILSPLGKNMLLVFLLSMVVNELVYMNLILVDMNLVGLDVWYGPIFDMLLAGIAPILLMWAVVWILYRYDMVFKLSLPTKGRSRASYVKLADMKEGKIKTILLSILSHAVIICLIAYGVYILLFVEMLIGILTLLLLVLIEVFVIIVAFRKVRK